MDKFDIRETPHILNPEHRQHVSAILNATVVGEDEEEAVFRLQKGDWIEWFTPELQASKAEYDGAWIPDRWRAACAACWFAGGADTTTVKRGIVVDGESGWWATDNHVLLRCDGNPPPGVYVIRMDKDKWRDTVHEGAAREPVGEWVAIAGLNNTDLALAQPSSCAIQSKYLLLVEAGRVDRWETSGDVNVPALAYLDGRVEAVVMCCKRSDEDERRQVDDLNYCQQRLDSVRAAARAARSEEAAG